MERGKHLAVIVINYNTREYLRKCIRSILADQHEDAEVWVVDNASDDGSVEMVKREFPRVRLLISKRNVGFAAANNMALQRARGEYLLLLNSDITLRRGATESMMRFMEETPEAGVAGGKLLNLDGSIQPSCRKFPTYGNLIMSRRSLIRRLPRMRKYRELDSSVEEAREVEAVAGAFMIIRRKALLQVGLFDSRFFFYVEDTDLCLRMRNHGWKVYFVPGAEAFHVWGGTAQKKQRWTLLQHHKSMWRFFEKHHPERRNMNFALLVALFIHMAVLVAMVTVRPDRKEVGDCSLKSRNR